LATYGVTPLDWLFTLTCAPEGSELIITSSELPFRSVAHPCCVNVNASSSGNTAHFDVKLIMTPPLPETELSSHSSPTSSTFARFRPGGSHTVGRNAADRPPPRPARRPGGQVEERWPDGREDWERLERGNAITY
jgi:hypothetical protein